VESIKYERAELASSDHKPVLGLYSLNAIIIDEEARQTIEQNVTTELPGVFIPAVLAAELLQGK